MGQWVIGAAGGRWLIQSVCRAGVVSAGHILAIRRDTVIYTPPTATMSAAEKARAMPWRLFPAGSAHRIYAWPAGLSGSVASIVEGPLYLQWLAEILHPETMHPALRGMIRDTLAAELGVKAQPALLDAMVEARLNASPDYARRFVQEQSQ